MLWKVYTMSNLYLVYIVYVIDDIRANIAEANGAISKADFRAKMSIAYKECLEVKYWLSLLKDTGYINENAFASIQVDAEEISKILWKILKTTNSSLKKE